MKTISLLLLSCLTVLAPIKGLIILLTLLVGADTIFGIYAAVKLGGKNKFKSTKLFNIVVKTFFYVGSLVVVFLADLYIFGGSIYAIPFLLSKITALFWFYIEVKSIDETSMKLGNKSLWVIIVEIIKKAKQFKQDLNDIKS